MRIWARVAGLAVAVLVMVAFLTAPAFPLVLAPAELLSNGSFEADFTPAGVATGWLSFGQSDASLRWRAESAEPALWDGARAQRLSIIEENGPAAGGEEYIGIYQSVDVTPGAIYQLTVHGALLADAAEPPAGVTAQWGVDAAGGDWPGAVREWMILPWEPALGLTPTRSLRAYVTTFTAANPRLTLFLRLHKPATAPVRQLDLLLDGLSLREGRPAPAAGIEGFGGPAVSITVPAFPVAGQPVLLHVLATHAAGVTEVRLFDNGVRIGRISRPAPAAVLEERMVWLPQSAGEHRLRAEANDLIGNVSVAVQAVTVGAMQTLTQGDVSTALSPTAWRTFSQGGAATLEGDRLRLDGGGAASAGAECFAGVYRPISGMRPGASYELRLVGQLDETPAGERWSAEYALAWEESDAPTDDALATLDWQPLPWAAGEADPTTYGISFTARGAQATLLARLRRQSGSGNCAGAMAIASVNVRGYQ